jgi:putative endonuclease
MADPFTMGGVDGVEYNMTKKHSPTQQSGYSAEALAEQFLNEKGLQVLQRQFRTSLGEIDLIMRDQSELVFVEVKFRSANDFMDPIETVTPKKRSNLIRTAYIYMNKRAWTDVLTKRFDVICVSGCQLIPKITWIPNAFGVE